MGPFSKALIIYKPVEKCFTLASESTVYLRSHGVNVLALTVDDLSHTYGLKTIESDIDLVISIGGDGTFIRASKLLLKPLILPYPCGRRNTYYEYGLPSIEEVLNRVLSSRFYLEFIPLYQICYGSNCSMFINDAVIVSSDLGKASKFSIKVKTHDIDSDIFIEGDGLIISTMHGSSGHGLSAGGPLTASISNVLILNYINPIQLSSPSLVIPGFSVLEIVNRNNALLYVDGDHVGNLDKNTNIIVNHGLRCVKVIRFNPTRDIWRSVLEPRKQIH
ncbi:MAG: NAD(+)/NADH kinase [Desulfurococcaceae archaeon]